MIENNHGEVIVYQSSDGLTRVDVRFQDETVWLTQQQMTELFQTSRTNRENEQGTVHRLLYQPLTALYVTPTLIPVSLDACLIDTPSFSALRRTSSRLLLSNL